MWCAALVEREKNELTYEKGNLSSVSLSPGAAKRSIEQLEHGHAVKSHVCRRKQLKSLCHIRIRHPQGPNADVGVEQVDHGSGSRNSASP